MLKDKVIVVMGASGLVGSGIARVAKEQDAIVATMCRNEERMEELRKHFEGYDRRFFGLVGKSDTLEGLEEFKQKVVEKFGKIDVVVASLGKYESKGTLTQVSEKDVQSTFENNIMSHWRCAKVFLPYLKERDDSVYILITGGLSKIVLDLNASLMTMGLSGVCGLSLALQKETQGTKVRFHELMIRRYVKREEHLQAESTQSISNLDVGRLVARIIAATKSQKQLYSITRDLSHEQPL